MTDEGMRGDPIDAAEMISSLGDMAVSVWTMFVKFKEQGFTEQQAFDLVRSWIHGSSGGKL